MLPYVQTERLCGLFSLGRVCSVLLYVHRDHKDY